MNTGQTMLTIGALALLSIITMRYYATIGNSGQSLAMSNAGLTATTVATSFIERAQNTAFDEVSATTAVNLINSNINLLTAPLSLGREGSDENICLDSLDDFDDFHGWTETYTPAFMNETYKVNFEVFYVDTNNIETKVTSKRTFLKRMNLKVWRSQPPGVFDTVRMSTIYGYFKYN